MLQFFLNYLINTFTFIIKSIHKKIVFAHFLNKIALSLRKLPQQINFQYYKQQLKKHRQIFSIVVRYF
jgi:hypothetical protein